MKIDTIIDRLLAIKQKKSDLEKEERTLKGLVDNKMGKKKRMDVGNYAFIREERLQREYTMDGLREIFKDEDVVNSCLAPNKKLVVEMIKNRQLTKFEKDKLKKTMIVTGKTETISLKKLKL